jgi:hypothetical protein
MHSKSNLIKTSLTCILPIVIKKDRRSSQTKGNNWRVARLETPFMIFFCFSSKKARALKTNSMLKALKNFLYLISHHNQKAKSTF